MGGNGCSQKAVSGWALGIPQDQPENTFWAGHSGVQDITRIPARNCLFWLAIRDTTRIPTRKDGSGWAFGIQPNNQPEQTFSGWCSGYYPKTSQKTRSFVDSGLAVE
ncbi:hypothetical protein BYT27DRAFT_7210973 [Phlegmacium glaucopus]|nr:hypothetical protein BYT27DRAFT_7210973 [Phlegmacium glaucopus]